VVTKVAAPRTQEQQHDPIYSARTFRTENHRLHPLPLSLGSTLFHVCRGVPIADALAQASDLLLLAKSLTVDATYAHEPDRHAWAAHYLTTMSKAVIDDVVKVLTRRPIQTTKEASPSKAI
jgi:hypothetical protein